MAEGEVTDYFSMYIDWVPPTSTNESSSDHHHRTLSSVGDAVMCIVATILSVITAGGNLPTLSR